MKEFKNILDLTCNLHLIPNIVAIDTLKRITDWLVTPGNSVDDNYIKKQLAYASKFVDRD